MEVFEHEDTGAAVGDRLEEPPPGRRSRLPARLPITGQPDQRLELALQPAALTVLRNVAVEHVAELSLCLVGGVGLEDARLCLDDLS